MRLGLISSIALAGFLYMSAPPGAVAAQVPQAVVQTVESSSHNTTVLAYYYYHGRRYPYRYHGRYYGHRRYSHGHWRYY
jgi:hypothetical protein